VDDGKSALCFPPGDAVLLAEQIRSLFLDDGLLTALSVCARETALARQSRVKILGDMVDIYGLVAEASCQEGVND
ncbi:MAG TPA: hypothetical protein VLX29_00180, partial [Nitrospirota bacterium]|nr:hypothetical protein [Nitrospirota bacterium]